MEGFPSDKHIMHTSTISKLNLTVLSYHEFYDQENKYAYSRTFKQFRNDLDTKIYDLITLDDGHIGCLKACEMMRMNNIRAMLLIPTSLMGQNKYLSWPQINYLSKFHIIGNHSHHHVNLTELSNDEIQEEMLTANMIIEKHTGKRPRFFVPPFNKSNKHVDNIALKFGLQIIKNRVDILNTTI